MSVPEFIVYRTRHRPHPQGHIWSGWDEMRVQIDPAGDIEPDSVTARLLTEGKFIIDYADVSREFELIRAETIDWQRLLVKILKTLGQRKVTIPRDLLQDLNEGEHLALNFARAQAHMEMDRS